LRPTIDGTQTCVLSPCLCVSSTQAGPTTTTGAGAEVRRTRAVAELAGAEVCPRPRRGRTRRGRARRGRARRGRARRGRGPPAPAPGPSAPGRSSPHAARPEAAGSSSVAFGLAVGERKFWVRYLCTVHNLNHGMGIRFGAAPLEIALLYSVPQTLKYAYLLKQTMTTTQ